MADGGSGMASTRDSNALAKAVTKAGSFFKKETVKPLVIGGVAGGLGVVTMRYLVTRYIKTPLRAGSTTEREPETATNAQGVLALTEAGKRVRYMRAAAKFAGGLVAAQVIKKYSPVAAIGVAMGCGVDAIADLTATAVYERMDRWFTPERTTAGLYGRNGGGGQRWTAQVQ